MPVYQVTDPTSGHTLQLTGNAPPSEQDLNTIFAQTHGTPSPAAAATPYHPSPLEQLQQGAQKITDFTGLTPLAKGLGSLLGTRPASDLPTTKQVAGSAIQGIASVGGAVLGPAESLVGRLLGGAAVGGANALGQGLQQNSNAGTLAKQTGEGAVLGAGTIGALEGAGTLAKGAANKAADYAYNSAVNTPLRQLLSGKEDIAQGLKTRAIAGTLDSMMNQVKSRIQEHGQALEAIIHDNAGKPVDITPVKQALTDLQLKLKNTPGGATSGVDSVLQAFGKAQSLPLQAAQEIKQNLQADVNNAFMSQTTTGVTQAQKIAAQKLRRAIEQTVPEVAAHNSELEFGLRAVPALMRGIAKKEPIINDLLGLGLSHFGGGPLVAAQQVLSRPGLGTPLAQAGLKAARGLPPELNALLTRALSGQAGRQAP